MLRAQIHKIDRPRYLTFLFLLASLSAYPLSAQNAPTNATAENGSLTEATANFAPNPPAGEWPSQARDYANTRYSPLDQINTSNVGRLRMAWSFADGTQFGHEGAPLVVGDTMYVVTPYPNIAYALDLTKPGAPIKWTYESMPSPLAIGKACCDAV